MPSWSTEECSRCHGAGAIMSERLSKSLRCTCIAGRQLAESEIAASIIQVTALMKRKESRR